MKNKQENMKTRRKNMMKTISEKTQILDLLDFPSNVSNILKELKKTMKKKKPKIKE